MNQFQWTFLDNRKKRHTLGIAHSSTSGHLVVHVNQKIMLIEFNVLESRDFSFFIEEELCILSINGNKEEGFTYNFEIDKEIDTELNRTRNEKNKKERNRGILQVSLAAIIIISILVGGTLWVYNQHLERLPVLLRSEGLSIDGVLSDKHKISYQVRGFGYNRKPLGKDLERLKAIRLSEGSELSILVEETDPKNIIINWPVTLFGTKDASLKAATAKKVYESISPELGKGTSNTRCLFTAVSRLESKWNIVNALDAYLLADTQQETVWNEKLNTQIVTERAKQICLDKNEVH